MAGLIGVVLGALGSGGAILALPVLVYAAALPVSQAIAVSQFVVGVASLFGAGVQLFAGRVSKRQALVHAVAGIPATKLGSMLREQLPDAWLMAAFSFIVIVSGWRMLRAKDEDATGAWNLPLSAAVGAIVGALTGLIGVGGGFLLVPAMIAYGGLNTKLAMATSLPVIALNSLSGAWQSQALWLPQLNLALGFLGATLVGTFAGIRIAERLNQSKLRLALAGMLMLVGGGVAIASFWPR